MVAPLLRGCPLLLEDMTLIMMQVFVLVYHCSIIFFPFPDFGISKGRGEGTQRKGKKIMSASNGIPDWHPDEMSCKD